MSTRAPARRRTSARRIAVLVFAGLCVSDLAPVCVLPVAASPPSHEPTAENAPTQVLAPPAPRQMPVQQTDPPVASAQTDGKPEFDAPQQAPQTSAMHEAPGSLYLFHIERNKNRNQVHYALQVDEQCRPRDDRPVEAYWLRLEEGDDVVRPLSFFQHAAYGFRGQDPGPDGIRVGLRALPDRPLRVVARAEGDTCTAAAYISVAGSEARLRRVYVSADKGFLMPRVRTIDLFATAPDGSEVEERIEVD